MPNYATPGVYIEEVSGGARPIEAVGTSTAAFLGAAPDAEARLHAPRPINNWTQFVREFASQGSAATPLAQAVFGFFLNGGSRCYVVNTGPQNAIAGGSGRRTGIDTLEELDEVAIVVAPGSTDTAAYEVVLSHCEKLKDRVAILDAPEEVPAIDALTRVATAGAGRRSRRGTEEPSGAGASEPPALRPRQSDGGYGALYFPWITVRDPLGGGIVNVPPSGHLAGIYARTDATRGVHKAPANELVRGALDVTYRVTHEEQGLLNQHGVNCIRLFGTEGIRVWGARTLAPSASEWRYLSVRRLFNMIEESIARSTRWVVFEPNDMPLWKAIRRDVEAFLTRIWRQGALVGRTPDEAFFVQCDEETNPPESVDAGTVVILVGMAPVKPAEFVVFRISQSAEGTEVTRGAGAAGGAHA